jgi:hypothetical protein
MGGVTTSQRGHVAIFVAMCLLFVRLTFDAFSCTGMFASAAPAAVHQLVDAPADPICGPDGAVESRDADSKNDFPRDIPQRHCPACLTDHCHTLALAAPQSALVPSFGQAGSFALANGARLDPPSLTAGRNRDPPPSFDA